MTSDGEVVLRLFLAVLFSGLIGLEREVSGRAAGFRTHILVSVGSALMMLTGMDMAQNSRGAVDPTRIAAQVVSGIGFLGAGTIIQYRDTVRGLTTAASLWAAAGIGLASGAGFYVGAVTTTGIVLLALLALSRFERQVVRTKQNGGDAS